MDRPVDRFVEEPLRTSGALPPLHHVIEMIRVRQAIENAIIELGSVQITSGVAAPMDDREEIVSTFGFLIEGLDFEARVVLRRRTH